MKRPRIIIIGIIILALLSSTAYGRKRVSDAKLKKIQDAVAAEQKVVADKAASDKAAADKKAQEEAKKAEAEALAKLVNAVQQWRSPNEGGSGYR